MEWLQQEWAQQVLAALGLTLVAVIGALGNRLVRAIEGSNAAAQQLSAQELRERITDEAVAAAEALGGDGGEKLQRALDLARRRGPADIAREEIEAALMRASGSWRAPQWVRECAEMGGVRLVD